MENYSLSEAQEINVKLLSKEVHTAQTCPFQPLENTSLHLALAATLVSSPCEGKTLNRQEFLKLLSQGQDSTVQVLTKLQETHFYPNIELLDP